MKNATNDLLDQVKVKHGFTSDYQLAKRLGISSSRLGNYRAQPDKHGMNEELALRVAELLECAPGEVLARLAADRAKSPAAARAWRELLQGIGGKAAALVLAIAGAAGVSIAPRDANAAISHNQICGDQAIHCALYRRARRMAGQVLGRLVRWLAMVLA